MTTLIIGGNGKTGLHLASLLNASSKPFLIASRSGTSSNPDFSDFAVKFNWFDPSTYSIPFASVFEKGLPQVDKLYLIAPPVLDVLPTTKEFVDLAVKEGVKRIVFLSASDNEKGGFYLGKIHEYLDGLQGIWYAALRPTWFIENLKEMHVVSITSSDRIYSGCGDGLIPFVGAEDIAQAAYDALFSAEDGAWPRGRAPIIVGPESITHDQMAGIVSKVLGRTITHVKRVPGDPRPEWDALQIPKDYQVFLEEVELRASKGHDDAFFKDKSVDKVIGKRTVKDWIEKNKAIWAKD